MRNIRLKPDDSDALREIVAASQPKTIAQFIARQTLLNAIDAAGKPAAPIYEYISGDNVEELF